MTSRARLKLSQPTNGTHEPPSEREKEAKVVCVLATKALNPSFVHFARACWRLIFTKAANAAVKVELSNNALKLTNWLSYTHTHTESGQAHTMLAAGQTHSAFALCVFGVK